MHVPSFIERKRDGGEATAEEVAEFIRGFTSGEIPEYQASAWAMAVFFRGMTPAETSHLTRAMLNSGRVLEYPAGSPPKSGCAAARPGSPAIRPRSPHGARAR